MNSSISLKCSCGLFRGVVSGVSNNTGRRCICMCDDCQAYAHYLGRADEILDKHGGTDVFSVEPAKITISSGIEHLKCVRLTQQGMFRWYAGCCNTPISNSMKSYKIPFTGIIHLIMDHKNDAVTRNQIF